MRDEQSTARKLSDASSPSLGFSRPRVLLIGIGVVFFCRLLHERTHVEQLSKLFTESHQCTIPVQFGENIKAALVGATLRRNPTVPVPCPGTLIPPAEYTERFLLLRA